MGSKTEATVAVLTAELKTLVIGTRQVTIGIWSQLDEVPDDQIIPFGRVSPPGNQEYVLWVVGKSVKDGSLVRSSLPMSVMGRKDWVSARMDELIGNFPSVMDDRQAYLKAYRENQSRIEEELIMKIEEWQALDLIVLAGLGLR
jgi:hypothetical protein